MFAGKFTVDETDTPRSGFCILKAAGVLDAESAPVLEKSLRDLYDQGRFDILIDLGDVEFISSAGWGIFTGDLKFARENGGDIKLAALQPDVLDIFLLLELDHFIDYYNSIDEALGTGAVKQVQAEPPVAPEVDASGDDPGEAASMEEEFEAAEEPEAAGTPHEEEEIRSPEESWAKVAEPVSGRSDVEGEEAAEKLAASAREELRDESKEDDAKRAEAGILRLGSAPGDDSVPPSHPVSSEPPDSPTLVEEAERKPGLWRRLFGRKSRQDSERQKPRRAQTSPGESAPEGVVRWGAKRNDASSNLAYRAVSRSRSDQDKRPKAAVAPERTNVDAEVPAQRLADLRDGKKIAAVVREEPELGPTRIKRRMDERAGGDCNLSKSTIYRRLVAASLNTRDKRIKALERGSQTIS